MQSGNRPLRQIPQRFVKRHIKAPACLAIKKRARAYRRTEHLFQAKRLSAELDPIGIMGFGLASLVFHRKASHVDWFSAEFHNIRLSDEAPFERA